METQTVRDLIPSVTELANALSLTPNAIYRWIAVDRIPGRYLVKVANHYDIEIPLHLASSDKKHGKTVKVKPKGALDALLAVYRKEETIEVAAQRLDLNPQTIRVALTHWGDELPNLVQTIRDLNEDRITVADAAERLGVTKHNVHALRKKWGEAPKRTRKPEDNHTQTKRERTRQAALGAIEGRLTLEQAQEAAGQSWRTVHRWIEKLSPDIGLVTLTHWPKSFRLAYSDEIERNLDKMTPKLVEFAEKHGLFLKKYPKYPEKPENWRKTTTKRMMIGVLTDEIDLETLAVSRGADPAILQTLFTGDLRVLDLTWGSLMARPLSFQIAVAELLMAVEDRKRKVV